MSKRMSQKDRVLEMLRDGPVTGRDITLNGILQYNARIHELRKDGHDIEKSDMKTKSGVRFGVFTLHEEEK